MLPWLSEHLGTVLIGVGLLLLIGCIAWRMYQNKKKGRSSCGCGCSGCAMREHCHSKDDKTK